MIGRCANDRSRNGSPTSVKVRVASRAENRPRWCVAHVAVLRAGGLIVPLDAQLGAEALQAVPDDAGARRLFVSAELAPRVEELARMLAGDKPTPALRKHARAMLESRPRQPIG